MTVKFLGTGYYVPEKILTNEDLSQMVDTTDEWIIQRVGVRERHISVYESTADMGTKAALAALENAGIQAADLDLIVAATVTPDSLTPSVAALVQKNIGAGCPAFDVSAACSGFMFALETAVSYIARGGVKHALVLGAERLSKFVDWQDRSTCVIFGDGAGAAVIGSGGGYLSSLLYTKGGSDVIEVPAFAGISPFYKGEKRLSTIFMEGQETFKFAVNKIVRDIRQVTAAAGIDLQDIDHIVTHQANIRIIEYASKKLGIPMDKFFVNIHKYGNTSAASVPIALAELNASGGLKRGDIVVLAAFGGGLSSGCCVLRW